MSFFKSGKKTNSYGLSPNPSTGEDANAPSPKAIIYKSELDFISRCILDYPHIETGGELFGFWTQLGTPVVLYAVGPGPHAQHHPTAFLQDPEYVDNIEVKICNITGLQHIGQWHSHHQLGLAHPSGGDVASMQRGVGQPGFPRMLLCIGNCTRNYETTVNAFNFHENTPGQYLHAKWDVINIESPFRKEINNMFGSSLYLPQTREARYLEIYEDRSRNQPAAPDAPRQHWLTERIENIDLMKGFLKSVEELLPASDPTPEIMDSGEPIVSMLGGAFRIILPYGFPDKSPLLMTVNGRDCKETDPINEEATVNWMQLYMPLDQKFKSWLHKMLPVVGLSYNYVSPSLTPDSTSIPDPTPIEEDDIDLNNEE